MLAGHDSSVSFELPFLLALLNTFIPGCILLAVVLMATRSYQVSGAMTFLMMGCGALSLCVSNLMVSWLMPLTGNVNPTVTLHNVSCLFAGVCHLASAQYLLADLAGTPLPRTRSRRVAMPYMGIAAFMCAVAALAVLGKLPVFIAPGAGPTMYRQFVLGGALWMFALSGLMFAGIYFAMKTEFAYWYGLALLLSALGLVCAFFLRTVGGTLGWVARSAQYLGSVYFIFALAAGRREMGQANGSAAATTRWGIWPYLEQKVKERTLALEKANEDLQKEVAARKLAEQALQESEELYRRLFEVESDAILVMERETRRFIDANPAALKLYGYGRQEFLLLKAGDISAEPEKTSQSMAEGQKFIPLRWHRKKDGAVFPVEIFGSFFYLRGRGLHVAVIRDITERKRAEEELRKSEAQLRAILDATPFPVALVDVQGYNIEFWSRSALTLFGHTAPTATEWYQIAYPDPDYRGKVIEQWKPALEKARLSAQPVNTGEYRISCRDGSVRICELYATFLAHRLIVTFNDITERRLAEEELRRSETKFRTLYDSTSDAIMLLGDKGFFDCNPATLAIFGCATREEFCSEHPGDLSPPTQPDGTDSRTLADRQIAMAMEKGSHHFEWMHKRSDTDEAFPADVLLSAMELDGKRVLQATVRDITERKQAEEAVSKAQAMQRAIFDSTDDFIWAVDSQRFGLLAFNRAFRDYSLQQRGHRLRVGQRPEDLLPNTEYIERWHGYFQRAMASGPFTTEYLAASGKVTLLLTFNLLKFDKAIFGVSVFGKDITELKRAGEELKESEERLRLAADAAGFGIYRYDFASGTGYWSPEFRALLGVPPDQPLALDADKLFVGLHSEDRPGFLAAMTAANDSRGSGFFLHDYRVIHPNGEVRWLHVRGHTTFAGEGADRRAARATGVVLDITDRKRTEEDVRDSHEKLRALAARMQTVREEERTRIAREIHDVLAQDLTSLKIDATLLASLLARSPGEPAQGLVRKKLTAMTIATDTAIQSVQKIATDLRPVVLDSLGLGAAIEWQIKDFQARTGIGCQARLPARDLPLDRDRSTALFRILQEGLTNVARHAAATRVEIVLQREAGHVILTIVDNGRGIQECQANAPGAVGLLGMRERALLLGGRCDIRGRPGEGTRVEVRLPLPPTGNSEEKQL